MSDREEWKPVRGYEGLYEISNSGQVKSLRRGLMKLQINHNGYPVVRLTKSKKPRNWRVHRLVAEHFVAGQRDELEVNHIDGDKKNNCASNLEWVTRAQNIRHAFEQGIYSVGSAHHRSKLTEEKVRRIRKLHKNGVRMTTIAETFGVSVTAAARAAGAVRPSERTWLHVE